MAQLIDPVGALQVFAVDRSGDRRFMDPHIFRDLPQSQTAEPLAADAAAQRRRIRPTDDVGGSQLCSCGAPGASCSFGASLFIKPEQI